jgi:hypothetical protein
MSITSSATTTTTTKGIIDCVEKCTCHATQGWHEIFRRFTTCQNSVDGETTAHSSSENIQSVARNSTRVPSFLFRRNLLLLLCFCVGVWRDVLVDSISFRNEYAAGSASFFDHVTSSRRRRL